jgi:hypothetical protein
MLGTPIAVTVNERGVMDYSHHRGLSIALDGGDEAERIGVVSRAVPRERLLEVATDYAERLARAPEVALRFTKRSINQWLRLAEIVSQDYALTLEALSEYSGERAGNPHTDWPPRQVP